MGSDGEARIPYLLRQIEIPAASSWDQWRGARLAIAGLSPIDPSDVSVEIVRLGRWGLGRPGYFAVCIVKKADLLSQVSVVAEAGGRPCRFTFRPADVRKAQLRSMAVDCCFVLAAVCLFALGGFKAWTSRAQRDATLSLQETKALALARAASLQEADENSYRILKLADADHGSPLDLAADLAWVARAKAPASNFQGLHWHQGIIEITAIGFDPILSATDRKVEMEASSQDDGLSLWRVGLGRSAVETAGFVRPSVLFQAKPKPAKP
jgi:hypothetical protein